MGQRMLSPPSSHITNPWKTPEQTASSSHGHDEVISQRQIHIPQIFQTTHVTVVVIDMLIKIS